MLVKLNCSGYGCRFGKINAATIAYADDVLLLSGSLVGLQCLVNICVEFGLNYGMSFNAVKSMCMVFSSKEWRLDPPAIIVGGLNLTWVKMLKYLGVIV
jgi:Reverse transcriptase (RNA-dependent DNA polymerase)